VIFQKILNIPNYSCLDILRKYLGVLVLGINMFENTWPKQRL